jgi:hypothetical protein
MRICARTAEPTLNPRGVSRDDQVGQEGGAKNSSAIPSGSRKETPEP